MKSISCLVILTLAGFAFAAEPPSTPTSQPASDHRPTTRATDEQLNKLQAKLLTVETVEADFTQNKRLTMLDHELKIRGHFALQKPNKMIWNVREPVKYCIRIEGETLQQWDEDTNRVQVTHLGGDPTFKAISEQLQSWFLGDYKALAKNYDVYVEGENPLRLGFTPRGDTMVSKVLKHVDLRFGKDDLYIDQMIVREAGGDITTLNFIDTNINKPVKAETWEIPPHDR